MADQEQSSRSEAPTLEEQVVAYLDGELDESQSAAMERKLRRDPRLRQLAEQLDRTWGMLDALDTVTANEQFSQETMKTVVAASTLAAGQQPSRTRQLLTQVVRSQALVWFGIGVLGAVIGLAAGSLRPDHPEAARAEQILTHLDMLSAYPRYSVAPSLAALQGLDLPDPGESQERAGQ